MSEENKPASLKKRIVIFGLLAGFLIMGIRSMDMAMPEAKEERIYKAIKVYSPYHLEKRIGGLTILNSKDEDFKEKINAADILHRLDELDKRWGKNHLKVENNDLVVTKDDNTTVKIQIKTPKERAFIKSFFGL